MMVNSYDVRSSDKYYTSSAEENKPQHIRALPKFYKIIYLINDAIWGLRNVETVRLSCSDDSRKKRYMR